MITFQPTEDHSHQGNVELIALVLEISGTNGGTVRVTAEVT